jgi:hypothetical protein
MACAALPIPVPGSPNRKFATWRDKFPYNKEFKPNIAFMVQRDLS